ncbi:RNA polymerase sigma factor [uncultured Sunxiuqinia sp.]|uniref:RNA polymerase sigma factor n=1 Tax=uncultured Sunxiuqinia sp. TaxID=1573825 RepID=UPI002AA8F904|nr:RNA polymerase sigma factor [uncultured Sunxiuqinia sp.]
MDEEQLIQAIQTGDERAFKQLVEKYQLLVVNTCKSFVHNMHDAEDISQDVFIEVFNSAYKFRGESKLSTWIYRITVNKSLNFIRDHKKQSLFQSIGNTLFGTSQSLDVRANSYADRPDFQAENNERKANLYQAIDALPERQRIAFNLSKFEDLSYREVADVMQLSVSSVESLIHRAKLNLQKSLYACYKNEI